MFLYMVAIQLSNLKKSSIIFSKSTIHCYNVNITIKETIMSMPIMLTSKEVLQLVRDKLLKQENNIEILEQAQYTSRISTLPSLKTESFILFKNIETNLLYVARTEKLEIKEILNIEDFKEIATKLPSFSQRNLKSIFNKINMKDIHNPKI